MLEVSQREGERELDALLRRGPTEGKRQCDWQLRPYTRYPRERVSGKSTRCRKRARMRSNPGVGMRCRNGAGTNLRRRYEWTGQKGGWRPGTLEDSCLGTESPRPTGLLTEVKKNNAAGIDACNKAKSTRLPEASIRQHHHGKTTTHLVPIHHHPILLPHAPVVDIVTCFRLEAHRERTA